MYANFQLPQLLESGEYSDCKITCGDKEFKLHKCIVCPQSPVLKTAFCGPFQESQTASFKADQFDPDHLQVMVNFFYHGNNTQQYRCSPYTPSVDTSLLLDLEDVQQEAIEHESTFHIRVNAVADYFQIPELLEESRSRLLAVVTPASPKVALVLLAEAYRTTGDRGLQVRIADLALFAIRTRVDADGNIKDGGDDDDDEGDGNFGVDVPWDVSLYLLRLCAGRINKCEERFRAMAAAASTDGRSKCDGCRYFFRFGYLARGICDGSVPNKCFNCELTEAAAAQAEGQRARDDESGDPGSV